MKKYDFSKRHWMIVILCFVMFIMNNACSTDGENVLLPKIAEANGWEYTAVLNIASIAGMLSVIIQLIAGRVCAKKGPKFVMVCCMICSAAFLLIYGCSTKLWMLAIGLFGVIGCSMSSIFIGITALIANWFPRKKGLAMGIVSMGPPVCTIIMISVLTMLINYAGLSRGVMVISAAVIILAIAAFFIVYDKPEMCGETPDNISAEEMAKFVEEEKNTATLTTKDILKIKDFWLIVGVVGILSLVTTGLMAQFLVRYTTSGYKESTAIMMLSITAIVGIFGSVLCGNMVNRLGTKRAYVFYVIIYVVALLINSTNIKVLVILSIPLLGLIITVLHNFMTAFQVSVFGRTNYSVANSLVFPIINTMGQGAFMVISLCIKAFGEVRYAYVIFAVLLIVSLVLSRFIDTKYEDEK